MTLGKVNSSSHKRRKRKTVGLNILLNWNEDLVGLHDTRWRTLCTDELQILMHEALHDWLHPQVSGEKATTATNTLPNTLRRPINISQKNCRKLEQQAWMEIKYHVKLLITAPWKLHLGLVQGLAKHNSRPCFNTPYKVTVHRRKVTISHFGYRSCKCVLKMTNTKTQSHYLISKSWENVFNICNP